MRLLLIGLPLIAASLALSYSPIPGYVSGPDCSTFKCNLDSKCFEVGDSSCDSPDCPTQPRCILNGQITCDKVKCAGTCLMVLQATSSESRGVAVPQCFPGDDNYGKAVDGGETDGNSGTGNGNGNGGDPGRVCPPPPQGPPGAPCPPENTCETCCKPGQRCTSIRGICEPRPGDPGPVCCPPIIRCFDCPQTNPCDETDCPYGQECNVIFPPCLPFNCCPSQAHCTPIQSDNNGADETGGYNRRFYKNKF